LYAAAYSLISRGYLLLTAIAEATLRQQLYAAVSRKDIFGEHRLVASWLLLVLSVGSAALLAILFFHEFIAKLFLAESYALAAELMPWIALGYLFFAMSQPYIRTCYAYGATRAVLIIEMLVAFLSIVVGITAIELFGLVGAAMAVPCYFGVMYLLAAAQVGRARSAGVVP
jgi:O-antigen/teichoic acid export membrane protein